ncbi:hypothetical protein M6D93_08255 [Jatrophihabitans telluris]|uniref:Uncharacterized protein n=1 Tax=Jatrophihabitans telluris TaxID=2038343 RepID=A0ABY4R494_9ACTN|nr:hypothetical protein [Jatrophihabitans telluris]UQX89982.1 hypothetical protein M6D93_08255 [Jatrophihabitans telluris]
MVSMTRWSDSLPRTSVAVGAMVVLAGLDVLGALLARRFAHSGSMLVFAAGGGCFLVLFWVYASSLRYAELIPVTFGWIAALQVGLLIAERVRSHTPVPTGHWVAAAGLIALEGYLLFSDAG